MATRTKAAPKKSPARRVKNPSPGNVPFPHLDPNYPVQSVVAAGENRSIDTICVQLDTGEWLATVVVPDRAATGRTKKAAEEAVRRKVRKTAKANPAVIPDNIPEYDSEYDRRMYDRRKHEKGIPLEEVLRRHGL